MLMALVLAIAAAGLDDDPAFRRAVAAYKDFDFHAARRGFERLAGRSGLADDERAIVVVWLGMCHAEEGALDEAVIQFERAASLDLDVRPLPTMSPKAQGMLEVARQAAREKVGPAPAPPPEPAPVPAPASPPAPVADGPSPVIIAGGAVTGIAAAFGVGAALAGVIAVQRDGEARALPGAREATIAYREAEALALVSTIAGVAAAAGVAIGGGVIAAGLLGAGEPEMANQ